MIVKCKDCERYEQTAIFELCKHPSSEYSIEGKVDYHTVSHMRTVGGCRKEANFFSRKLS